VIPYDTVMTIPEHLDPPSARFRAAYWRVMHDLDTLRLQQWEQSQVTLPQLRVLFEVRRSPGITTGQLARSLGVTVSTTSGLVTKLADGGLIARGSSQSDRRQIPLELTEAGRSLAGELAGVTRPFVGNLVEELGPELEAVIAGLESLAKAADRVRERLG
jgi:DNA-binding MarR family transcriptional regulator